MSDTIRAFVAIECTPEISDAVWQIQERLRALPPLHDLRWVDPFDSHLTLRFLGDTPVGQLPTIVEALDGVAIQWEPFTVALEGLGAFPNVFRPNVLWLGVAEGARPLINLNNAVEVALKKRGIPPERRDFYPHLTVARVPRGWDQGARRAAGDLIGPTDLPEVPPMTVEGISLMRVVLGPEGPTYTRLGHSLFGEAPPLEEDDWEDIP